MGLFKNFIEAEVTIDKTRKIRKNWKKNYRPGQFGVEIEYRATEARNFESEFDDNEARKAFRKQHDGAPPTVDEWLEDNEEPEEPDKVDPDSYEFNEDPLINLSNLSLSTEVMPKGLPEPITKYSQYEFEYLFTNVGDRWAKAELASNADEVVGLLDRLYRGIDQKSDRWKNTSAWNMMRSSEMLNTWKKRFLDKFNFSPDAVENNVVARGGNKLENKHVEYLREFNYAIQEAVQAFYDFHMGRAKAITPEIFYHKIEVVKKEEAEEYAKEYASWEEEHSNWEAEKEEVGDAHYDYDEDDAFEKWLDEKPNDSRLRNRYETNRDIFTTEIESLSSDMEDEIHEIQSWIKKHGGVGEWNVHEDESGVLEIGSPILTYKNIAFLKELMESLREKEFDSGTGLHVHIGMPEFTDAFDLIAMAATIDEKAIYKIAQRSEGSISNYAKTKTSLFGQLWAIMGEGITDNNELRVKLVSNIERYYGINTIQAFAKFGTVEMRYLSSQVIVDSGGIEEFFKFLNYFLMLPKLIEGKQQVRYDIPSVGTMIFSRRPGGRTEIRKFPVGQNRRPTAPMVDAPTNTLRQPENPVDKQAQLRQKFNRPKPPVNQPEQEPANGIV